MKEHHQFVASEVTNVDEQVRESLNEMLQLWNRMKTSEMDEAGDDADRFQMTFYMFMEHVEKWVQPLQQRPADAEEARLNPEFQKLFESLPDPLQIPFETELDAILADGDRHVDSTE
ncbi:hypothetical protein [Alicyclobacillus mengziensis]|uniref:Uncharacterized protein n=1 Tax=Alicyclobacillus mengziensis TaxID=2931921 RepID=A0A9X7VZE6_9BACL|nr:hypothetical protein [Alicyclobacillus mengziensis]QSO47814.1 hypothetical protein JZ786_01855 [Alicyclobacillus mengziensis]